MALWVGLGNPGKKYLKTRHNVGVYALINLFPDIDFQFDKSVNAFLAQNTIDGDKQVYLLPQTFMNLSGDAVVKALKFFKILPANMIVFHDEIDLLARQVNYKFGGGHRGHNGLRDIIQKISTADFHRFRIGVGRPPDEHMSVADYVLSEMPAKDLPDINEIGLLMKEKKLVKNT